MVAGPVDGSELHARIETARTLVEANQARVADSRARLSAIREESAQGRSERQQLHEFTFARLQARLESLPIIEQAKGVLMARTGGDPDRAFELLRRASQRRNISVRALAAEIVQRASEGADEPRVAPHGPGDSQRTSPNSPGDAKHRLGPG